MSQLDVLVCGRCREVFHFIDQFKDHKATTECSPTTDDQDSKTDTKPQIWAFTLWKNTQQKRTKPEDPVPTSWTTYQKWCQLDTDLKETWIAAGRNILAFSKIGDAKIQELKAKALQLQNSKPFRMTGEELEDGEIRKNNYTL